MLNKNQIGKKHIIFLELFLVGFLFFSILGHERASERMQYLACQDWDDTCSLNSGEGRRKLKNITLASPPPPSRHLPSFLPSFFVNVVMLSFTHFVLSDVAAQTRRILSLNPL
jgi:hypothetical protein